MSTGYFLGMPRRQALSSTAEEIRAELKVVLHAGFPITDQSAGEVLTEQRVVVANAQHPDERASRVAALERVVRQLLTGLGRSARGQAARTLFGMARGTRGTTLTFRRLEAAEVLERHEDHLRKHIEPKILGELAFAFHQENLRYTPPSAEGRPEIAAHDDTPVLTNESFTEQEELLCRVWAGVYGFRAELIATQRRLPDEDDAADPELGDHIDSAKWELAKLLTSITTYLDRYGDEILHGETPYNVEGVIALAGWHGGVSGDEAKRLRYALARSGPEDRQRFLDTLS